MRASPHPLPLSLLPTLPSPVPHHCLRRYPPSAVPFPGRSSTRVHKLMSPLQFSSPPSPFPMPPPGPFMRLLLFRPRTPLCAFFFLDLGPLFCSRQSTGPAPAGARALLRRCPTLPCSASVVRGTARSPPLFCLSFNDTNGGCPSQTGARSDMAPCITHLAVLLVLSCNCPAHLWHPVSTVTQPAAPNRKPGGVQRWRDTSGQGRQTGPPTGSGGATSVPLPLGNCSSVVEMDVGVARWKEEKTCKMCEQKKEGAQVQRRGR